MESWREWRDAVLKVVLALVPSLFAMLWKHWPQTPAERRAQERGSSDENNQSGGPSSP